MIRVENIHKSFGELQVLKGIDLEVNKGEIVSIVGSSGRENHAADDYGNT